MEAIDDAWMFLHEHLREDAKWSYKSYKLKTHLNNIRLAAVSVRDSAQPCPWGLDEHRRMEEFLYRFWLCNRLQLYDSDEIRKKEGMHKKALATTSTVIPFLALAHLVALRTFDGAAFEHDQTQCEEEWNTWKETPPGLKCLCNDKGYLVCDTPPYQQSLKEVKNVISFLCIYMRGYTYDYLDSVYAYIRMLLKRCMLLSVCDLEDAAVQTTAATQKFQDAQHWQCVCSFEMTLFAILYPCYIATKFERKQFSDSPGYARFTYKHMLKRVTAWLQSNTKHEQFNDVGALFRMDYESSLVRPSKREQYARQRGTALENISTQFLIQVKRPVAFQQMQDIFQKPLSGILTKKHGSWQARQLFYVRLMHLYLSGVGWPWEDVRVVREHELLDGNVVRKLLYTVDNIVVVQLFNGFVIVAKHGSDVPACYYACNNIIEVFVQFVLLTRDSALGVWYDAFYCRFRDTDNEHNYRYNTHMQIEGCEHSDASSSSSDDEWDGLQ